MVYIRSLEEALEELAGILDLALRRDQLVRSTVGIMSCLDAEPRRFMADCQALLIEGGLEALREKRREMAEAAEPSALVVLDPEEDRFFEAVASGLDALRLADVVHKVFPDLRASGRWLAARALLAREAEIKSLLAEAIRSGRETAEFGEAQQEMVEILHFHRPLWQDRAGTIRVACLGFLKEAGLTDSDRLHETAETLFELFAVSDERADDALAALDRRPQEIASRLRRMHETLEAVRSAEDGPPKHEPSGEGETKGVA